jgi:hypothetical protein
MGGDVLNQVYEYAEIDQQMHNLVHLLVYLCIFDNARYKNQNKYMNFTVLMLSSN